MVKRMMITAGVVFAFAGFSFGQSQNPPSGPPSGTVVTHHETSTVVQPKNAPVKVTRGVVKHAQERLNKAGYNSGPVDGIIGPQTKSAIEQFQVAQKLPQTGTLDQNTLAALNIGGVQTLAAAPNDLGRGGKAIGHDVVNAHPVGAAKAAAKGGEHFGEKVGQGTESLAIKAKDDVGSGISAIGRKITGAGQKTKNAGEQTKNAGENQQPPQK